jgi:hypothetical protein
MGEAAGIVQPLRHLLDGKYENYLDWHGVFSIRNYNDALIGRDLCLVKGS